MLWSDPVTMKELAAQRGWKRGEWRARLGELQRQLGERMVRRLAPLSPTSNKKRVVYQFVSAEQGSLWS